MKNKNQGAQTNLNYLPTPCHGCPDVVDSACVLYKGVKTNFLEIPPDITIEEFIKVVDNTFSILFTALGNYELKITPWEAKSYEVNEKVIYNGILYMATSTTTATEIPGSSLNWQIILGLNTSGSSNIVIDIIVPTLSWQYSLPQDRDYIVKTYLNSGEEISGQVIRVGTNLEVNFSSPQEGRLVIFI